MGKPWMVSVLSTGYDLEDYRKELISMLKGDGFEVSAYELSEFPVEYDKHSHDSCLIALNRADIAITIIGERSGGTYCGIEEDKKNISITEAEYFKAIKEGIPVFSFVRQETFDELHQYKKEFNKYCKRNKVPEDKREEGRKDFDNTYVCKFVKKVQTLHFVEDIQNAYLENKASNWMFFFTSIEELKDGVKGKLAGYSRALIQKLSEKQKEVLLDRHTSTSIGMSLRDVFSEEYYVAPPYTVESGKGLVHAEAGELSKALEGIDRSVLIYGEAGYGKTTVIAKCFVDHVDFQKGNPSYTIPLFLPLKNKGNSYHFDLARFIGEEFDELLQKDPYPYLDVSSLSVRFYCDGFDELAESLSEEDIDRIRKSTIFKFPLLLTCRQQFVSRYLNVHNFSDLFGVRIQMQKWSLDTVEKYVANYCDKKGIENKEKILSSIRENADLQQIINSPLLTTMFLRFLENTKDTGTIKDISKVELFHSWMIELSLREHSKRELPSSIILDVWKFTAWELYLHRIGNEKLLKEDLSSLIKKRFRTVNVNDVLATFDTLFEWKSNCLIGTFHEQFMEYLAANLLVDACLTKKEPYPDFLKIVLRPEINRYFREMWKGLPARKKTKIFDAIRKQYFDNVGKNGDDNILIRVHAVYHMCRLNDSKREEQIDRAFEVEKNISVQLSLYFGAIKLGKLDKEEEFYQLLNQEEYSNANRGYHLTYYADMIQNGTLPYTDDGCSDWQGTLKAMERHFNSGQLEHFFLWRIDLYTMKELIKERKRAAPLTNEIIEKIGKIISAHSWFAKYEEFYKKIENEMASLVVEFRKYSEPESAEIT